MAVAISSWDELDRKRILMMASYFNVVSSRGVSGFHPVRGEMFIDGGAKNFGSVRRSEMFLERCSSS